MPKSRQSNRSKKGSVGSAATAMNDPRVRDCDVVFGRGTPYMSHVGNLALHELTDQYMPLYKSFGCKSAGVVERIQKYGKSTKQEIVDGIIDAIHDKGGRFLRKDNTEANGQWVEVSQQEARSKVCHILRGRARRSSKAPQRSKRASTDSSRGSNTKEATPMPGEVYKPCAARTMPPFSTPLLALETTWMVTMMQPQALAYPLVAVGAPASMSLYGTWPPQSDLLFPCFP